MSTDIPAGLSVWERRLYEHLTTHVAIEAGAMDEHAKLENSSTGWVQFLLHIIGEDEARHHAIFERWASSVRAMGSLSEAADGIPFIRPIENADDVKTAARHLLEIERADERELKALHKEIRDVADTTLWSLLVDLMLLDTRKHQHILEFLLDHVEAK